MRFEDFQDGPLCVCVCVGGGGGAGGRGGQSYQVWAQSTLRFGRRCHLKNFKMAIMVAILDVKMERI